ncbi:lysophosphatidic acid acyltransferase [Saccharomycopsis crataegensis]|uniref:Lysophosphatidic acid acyltransferase n=1 Tax=Saccharomycopsis crataegensis TaxID=43959 RepID=A0AAV5QXJ2_9ASCO|nr:lysophosphatidic acid acyltransferase [Saccharomycopsis crataegensis]
MEKFTQWRDPGTGISPFMPVSKPKKSNVIIAVLQTLPKIVLALLRTPPLMLYSLVYCMVPLAFVRRWVISFLLNFLFSTNLFGSSYDASIEGIKRSNTKLKKANMPHPGDVIIVNHTSPLDGMVLYLISSNCSFLTFTKDGALVELSVWEVFTSALSLEKPNKPPVKLANYANKVVYLFAEGTTSNGKSILPYNKGYNSVVTEAKKGHKLKILAMKLTPSQLTTPIPKPVVSYLWELLTNFGALMFRIRIELLDEHQSLQSIREKSAEIGRLRLVGAQLDIVNKGLFVEAYRKNTRS